MEYVYEQQPMPTNATGVPVTITVIDSNGNYRQIGTTTTDSSGMYSFPWTPDIRGKYTVIATFAGTGSYYGSSVSSLPSQLTQLLHQQQHQPLHLYQLICNNSDIMMYIIGGVVAIIIAIAIVGLLLMRKKS